MVDKVQEALTQRAAAGAAAATAVAETPNSSSRALIRSASSITEIDFSSSIQSSVEVFVATCYPASFSSSAPSGADSVSSVFSGSAAASGSSAAASACSAAASGSSATASGSSATASGSSAAASGAGVSSAAGSAGASAAFFSWTWPNAIARPESSEPSPRTRPVSGDATTPASCALS